MKNKKSLKQLLTGIVANATDCVVTGITNDSREVKSGDVFLACVGETVDARQFIPEIIDRAAAVLYENNDSHQPSVTTSLPLIPVSNLDDWQGEIASRFYDEPSKTLRCVGVTGTNGKTTCTQWIAQALSFLKINCGVIGTLGSGMVQGSEESGTNAAWIDTGFTTPNPVLLQKELVRLRDVGAKAIAMEVSSHALAQGRVNGLHFDVAVFTQLSRDHLDYHGDMQSYADAKATLFQKESLRHAVINIDDAFGRRLVEELPRRSKVMTYSLEGNAQASIRATRIKSTSLGFTVDVKTPKASGQFKTKVLGNFNISNLLAVLGVLQIFEIPLHDAIKSIESLQSIPGRMQLIGGQEVPAVIVDYSHTPDALEKALTVLREHCAGKLWCVFGCGGDRDRGKRSEMAKPAETYSDHVIVTNDNPRTESPDRIVDDIMSGFSEPNKAKVVLDRADAIAQAIQAARKEDTILIAGKGHETYQIIGDRMLAFNDVEQVHIALRIKS